jgi:hypothetical protein
MKLKHFLYVAIGGVGLYFAYRALVHGSKKTSGPAIAGSGAGEGITGANPLSMRTFGLTPIHAGTVPMEYA